MHSRTVEVCVAQDQNSYHNWTPFELSGCKWLVSNLKRNSSVATVSIRCEPEAQNRREGWSCEVKLRWTYKNNVKGSCNCYDGNSKRTFCETQLQHEAVLCEHPRLGTTTSIRCSLTFVIQYFDGSRFRFQGKVSTFAEPSKFSDLVLQIDDRRFYVNKALLCLHSLVFEKMLCGQFTESGQKEIVIKDANPDFFIDFLKIIYNYQFHISDLNVTALLELYDRFDVSCVAQRCEEFLRSPHTGLSLAEKFNLADKFNLDRLTFDCCNEVDDDCTSRAKLEGTASFCALSEKMQNKVFRALLNWES